MGYYPITETTIQRGRLKLDAAIETTLIERAVLLTIEKAVNAYTKRPFNKLLIDHINTALATEYGTRDIERYDGNETIGNVYVSLNNEPYGNGKKFNYAFKGRELQRDYDAKAEYIGDKWTYETLYDATDIEALRTAITGRLEQLQSREDTARRNRAELDDMAAEHNDIVTALNAYNDKISYIIADDWRI